MAAYTVDSPEMVILLVESGADVNLQDKYGYTPLMGAINQNKPEIARLLVELGANIDARDTHGYTALMRVRNDNQTMIDVITKAVRKREIREKNKQIRAQKKAFYMSTILGDSLPRENNSITGLYSGIGFNPYIARSIADYAFGEEEKEEDAEESKRGDAGGRKRKRKRKSIRKKSRSKRKSRGRKKSATKKKSKSKRSKRSKRRKSKGEK